MPVDVIVPYSTLAFTSEGAGFVAELSFFVASADMSDNVSEVRRYDRKVKIRKEELKSLSKKFYVYGMDVELNTRTAENRLTVAVIDQLSKVTGFAVTNIAAPKAAVK